MLQNKCIKMIHMFNFNTPKSKVTDPVSPGSVFLWKTPTILRLPVKENIAESRKETAIRIAGKPKNLARIK